MFSSKLSVVYLLTSDPRFNLGVRGPLDSLLPRIRSIGIDGVEYNVPNPFDVDGGRLRRVTEDYGLEIPVLSTGLSHILYGINLSSVDDDSRLKAVKWLRRYIDLSCEIGSYRVVLGLVRGRCTDRSQGLQLLASSLREIDRYAYEKSVDILLEPLSSGETNLVNNLEEALRFVEMFRSIRILFDLYHALNEEKDLARSLGYAGRYIEHIHTADRSRGVSELEKLPLNQLFHILSSIGYRGYISLEARIEYSIDVSLRRFVNTVKALLKPLR
ncbi:MAG: sugar phosphate isomerase/epimerase family protein [Candidatus Bathyarchaeia archaeon]